MGTNPEKPIDFGKEKLRRQVRSGEKHWNAMASEMTESEALDAARKIVEKYPTEKDLLVAELQYVKDNPPSGKSPEVPISSEPEAKNRLERFRRIASPYESEDLRQMIDFDRSRPGFYSPMIMFVSAEEYIRRFPQSDKKE